MSKILPRSLQVLNNILKDLIHILVQDLTQDLKVFLDKIHETFCQQIIKNLARYFQDLVGIYVQDLGKIVMRSYRILYIFLLKYDLTISCTRSYTRS